jgi:lipoprotein-releasing system ATP-binding protein
MLELHSVSKKYGSGATAVPVLNDVCLSVSAGETVAIVGPSGSGKSTLLNIMGALDRPSTGTVTLEGRNLGQLNEADVASVRRTRIGFVFQFHHLLPQCNVLENVLVPTLTLPRDATAVGRARALLTRVGLEHRMSHRPGQLSGGERQRVAVVRALINQPALLLADEPTGSLDRKASSALVDLLTDLNRERGITIVMVTHSTDAAARMQHVRRLRDGTLEALDPA